MKYYRGFWSFAPVPECTTHIVEANNEEEAVEKLIKWALAHQGIVDEPMDFEVEELDSKRFELAAEIAYHEFCNGNDKSPWEVYEAAASYNVLTEMARDYTGELKKQQDTVCMSEAKYYACQRLSTILHLIRENLSIIA